LFSIAAAADRIICRNSAAVIFSFTQSTSD